MLRDSTLTDNALGYRVVAEASPVFPGCPVPSDLAGGSQSDYHYRGNAMTMTTCDKCEQVHERTTSGGKVRPTCIAHRSDGAPCRNWPRSGTTVCDQRHGGRTPQVKEAASRALQTQAIRAAASRLGVPRDIDAASGIIELVCEAAGNVAFYHSLVDQLFPDATAVETDPQGHIRLAHGLWERTFHQSGRPTGEAKAHITLQLYNDERDRWLHYCAEAVKVGVDERRLRIEEAQVRVLFGGVAAACAALGLSTDDALAFRRHFAAYIRKQVAINPELEA